jgi:uncharacterized lipoprotein YmbA
MALATAVTLSGAGCSLIGTTPPSHFYILAAVSDSVAPVGEDEVVDVGLGIGPVYIPQYLDRPQIVLRENRNQLTLSELDKWAEPLEDGVARVLGEDLAKLLGTDRVLRFPWHTGSDLDYRIPIRVERFDGELGAEVMLVVRWKLFREGQRGALAQGHTRIERPTEGASHRSLVKAMSAAMADLSRELAAAVRQAEADRQP